MTFILFLLLAIGNIVVSQEPSCYYAQYFKFRSKQNLAPEQIIPNPYQKPTPEYLEKVQENMLNKDRVCALKYENQTKKTYKLQNFETRSAAENDGWIVTHQGVCGKCSSTKDLYVYLTEDLTQPVRACGINHFLSSNNVRKCIKKLGFTDACTQVWLWNTLNTKQHCKWICIWALMINEDYVIDGNLNKCLQCDEDISGPIFKYESGRTRRNSGIHSEIDRPSDSIYNMTHCYY